MCSLMENIPEGIIIYNKEKNDIVMANQESRRLFKVSSSGFTCSSNNGECFMK